MNPIAQALWYQAAALGGALFIAAMGALWFVVEPDNVPVWLKILNVILLVAVLGSVIAGIWVQAVSA